MPTLSLDITPHALQLGPLHEPQLCYALLTITAKGSGVSRHVNWALIADASRSMRIPIVDEAQFRALIRDGGAKETLVDGVPVWQLSGPVPPEIRAASKSALDHVSHALHAVVERLDGNDRFALVACAEEAVLLNRSTSGANRVELVGGISRLKTLNLGEETDLAHGLSLALQELRRGRDGQRADRILLLTDGFTRQPDVCLKLAAEAASEGVTISTIGLGGEFQDDVLTGLADTSGGRALFLRRATDIARVVGQELDVARSVVARAVNLNVLPLAGASVRRITRVRPVLSTLVENEPQRAPQLTAARLGDLASTGVTTVLLELLVPPHVAHGAEVARLTVQTEESSVVERPLLVARQSTTPSLPAEVRDGAARANIARLQRRAVDAMTAGNIAEAKRLLHAAANRLNDLGEYVLAQAASAQADTLEHAGRANSLATKELTYATRRLGGEH